MDEGEVVAGELVKTWEDAAVVFELADEAFDEVTFFVEFALVLAGLGTVVAGWNDRLGFG